MVLETTRKTGEARAQKNRPRTFGRSGAFATRSSQREEREVVVDLVGGLALGELHSRFSLLPRDEAQLTPLSHRLSSPNCPARVEGSGG